MLKSSPILFALARTPANKGPSKVGAVVVVRLLAIYGGSLRLVAVPAVGCVLCTAVLIYSDVAALTKRTR